jgi:hypothetical protein
MLFINIQQVHPLIIIALRQSQHDPIIFALAGSPLWQVIVQPMSVISTLHMPIGMQQ